MIQPPSRFVVKIEISNDSASVFSGLDGTPLTAEDFSFTVDNGNLIDATITFKDCETFLYALCATLQPTTGSSVITKYIKPINNLTQLLFQLDDKYKEGLNGEGIAIGEGTNFVYEEQSPFIIQGLQLTGQYLIYSTNSSPYLFKNIYFKDWVWTATINSSVAISSSNSTYNFEDCLLSWHFRVHQMSAYYFDSSNCNWTHCGRYVEYSNWADSPVPMSGTLFEGKCEKCTTIVRIPTIAFNNDTRLIRYTDTCSWDFEFDESQVNAPSYIAVGTNTMNAKSVNSFFSVRTKKVVSATSGAVWQPLYLCWGAASFSGVNVYNFDPQDVSCPGDQLPEIPPNGVITIPVLSTSQNGGATPYSQCATKLLTTPECQDAATLSKWGFFTNTIEQS